MLREILLRVAAHQPLESLESVDQDVVFGAAEEVLRRVGTGERIRCTDIRSRSGSRPEGKGEVTTV